MNTATTQQHPNSHNTFVTIQNTLTTAQQWNKNAHHALATAKNHSTNQPQHLYGHPKYHSNCKDKVLKHSLHLSNCKNTLLITQKTTAKTQQHPSNHNTFVTIQNTLTAAQPQQWTAKKHFTNNSENHNNNTATLQQPHQLYINRLKTHIYRNSLTITQNIIATHQQLPELVAMSTSQEIRFGPKSQTDHHKHNSRMLLQSHSQRQYRQSVNSAG